MLGGVVIWDEWEVLDGLVVCDEVLGGVVVCDE